MTLQELYEKIGGDYEQAMRVLRMDKLLDKHIRKFANNDVVEKLINCENDFDPTVLFESSHAIKGVCANLGLTKISDTASDIAEEFRPGNERKMSDDEVKEKIRYIADMYKLTVDSINEYVNQ